MRCARGELVPGRKLATGRVSQKKSYLFFIGTTVLSNSLPPSKCTRSVLYSTTVKHHTLCTKLVENYREILSDGPCNNAQL